MVSWINFIFYYVYFQISGRLFPDSGPRRSTRLAGETGGSFSTAATSSTGNGTNQSSKHIGNSRLSNVGLRSVTIRKGQAWASDNFEEGNNLVIFVILYILNSQLANAISVGSC